MLIPVKLQVFILTLRLNKNGYLFYMLHFFQEDIESKIGILKQY